MRILRKAIIIVLSLLICVSIFMIARHFVLAAKANRPVDEILAERFGEYTPTETEQSLFNFINDEREKEGLAPYRFESGLHTISLIRAKEAAELWSHTRPDGRGYGSVMEDYELGAYFKSIGENLGRKFKTAEEIHKALMDSESHRKNILSDAYDGVSVAVYTDAAGNNYLCQSFVKRR